MANRSQAVICTPMQGFFPDRGVLGRQGRDTDASNGKVRAERRVLGPACGLVMGSKSCQGVQEKSDVASVVVLRWRPLRFGVRLRVPSISASLYFSRQKPSRADAILHAIGGVF